MITGKIDVTKIDKTKLFEGKKGKYLDVVLHDNKGGRDEYGNDGFITQGLSKEERAAGERGPIVGNWKHSGTGFRKPHERKEEEQKFVRPQAPDDDIPF